MPKIIAIDGGVATGTSTLAENLSKTLGIPRINSGSIYRAISFLVLKKGVDYRSEEACVDLASKAKILMPEGEVTSIDEFKVVEEKNGARTDLLHTKEVDDIVPIVASYRGIRNISNELQRKFASKKGAIVDGRDIGTVVFPKADIKLYLTCSDEEAAQRRAEADGRFVTVEEIRARNEADKEHEFGALRKANDAVEIDTTNVNEAQVTRQALEIISGQ